MPFSMTLPFSTNTLIISLLCLGIFFSLSTNEFLPAHARIFPWAGKNKSGQGEKIPRQRREIIRVFVENGSVIEKGMS